MKKMLVSGAIMLVLVGISNAKGSSKSGSWDFGGSVGLTQIGSSYYPKVTAYAKYNMTNMLSWRTDLSMVIRSMGDTSKFDLSVPSNLLFYPLAGKQVIDPYIGPGITWKHPYEGEDSFGGNLLAGVDFKFVKNTTFGIEARYTYDLLPEAKSGGWDMSLTGNWNIEF